jgi:hypothetical protein
VDGECDVVADESGQTRVPNAVLCLLFWLHSLFIGQLPLGALCDIFHCNLIDVLIDASFWNISVCLIYPRNDSFMLCKTKT